MKIMKMEFIEESELYKFKPLLLKSRVAFKKNDGTLYIAAFESGRIVGFVGFKLLPNSIRLKTDYVHEDCRGRGIYDQLFKKRLDIIYKKYGKVRMTSYCTEMSVNTYVRFGFKRKTAKAGITYCEYEEL